MTYEGLVEEAALKGIEICETSFKGTGKGFHIEDTIFINRSLSNVEKKCILAEELGHVNKTLGNIIDQTKTENRKQEIVARRWGYEKIVGILNLIEAFEKGARTRYDVAEYLEITEQFLSESISYYKQKYGLYFEIDNYIIYFEPALGVVKRF
ncbi:ImmA/IrrE family metallo-endopeptidase [Clostridium cadaveris]|uniref:ImmA/IrrE family metallo-endopeptidase n=1 Tax=Clostridium cadaveris TaxID=1529 RepID=UPI0015B4BCE3|nr:ImmA/IrrE family metallo-endopeptidase [Clostridium cadaveris]NWK12623.1 ImmA/IrrE family metallo-endopeptidase [Clostridium cadaveris]